MGFGPFFRGCTVFWDIVLWVSLEFGKRVFGALRACLVAVRGRGNELRFCGEWEMLRWWVWGEHAHHGCDFTDRGRGTCRGSTSDVLGVKDFHELERLRK